MLQGKVAVITGGTRGIGYATVKKFLENGAKVAMLGSREETVQKALASLKEENPEYPVVGYWPNLTKHEEVKEVFEKVKEEFGSLDVLVNNAGISARDPLYDYDPAAFEKIMDLNVNAVFNCSQVAACIMKEQGGGVILNTSSMVSIYGQPAGCGKDNIRVNAVAPGVIRTDMVAALPESVIQPLINTIPLRRVGEPEDIANAFVFLASDEASYITGVVLSVDGMARA